MDIYRVGSVLLIGAWIGVTISLSQAPQPCTNETALQTPGKWARQKKDDLAMADRTFPKEKYPLVLSKAQKVIDLLMAANPEFKGIQAYASRGIRGQSLVAGGALPFQVDAVYDSYICVGNNTHIVEARGKVLLNGVTNWTTIYLNSFGHALESLSAGRPFMTAGGDEIFQMPPANGELKGLTLLEVRRDRTQQTEAVVIGRVDRLPYKPVTREQFLQASISFFRAQAESGADKILGLNAAIDRMSPEERQMPAIIRNGAWPAIPGASRLFVTEADGGKRLVTIDKGYFDPRLPRDAIQFATVYWFWDDTNPSKTAMIREFKQNFDFAALSRMLGSNRSVTNGYRNQQN